MNTNIISKKLKTERVITIVEPHHDDFWLNLSGTMLMKDRDKEIDKIKIISIFGVSPGVSRMSTAIHKRWFNCDVVVKELWLKNLFNGWSREKKRKYKEEGGTCIKRFEEMNGKYNDLIKEIEKFKEGTSILPAGLNHADHNLLSKMAGDYYYREYPYYWYSKKRRESFAQGLYKEDDYNQVARVKLSNDIWYAKWRIFAVTYIDVLGTFNPIFSRPYFRNVRDEVYFRKADHNV